MYGDYLDPKIIHFHDLLYTSSCNSEDVEIKIEFYTFIVNYSFMHLSPICIHAQTTSKRTTTRTTKSRAESKLKMQLVPYPLMTLMSITSTPSFLVT